MNRTPSLSLIESNTKLFAPDDHHSQGAGMDWREDAASGAIAPKGSEDAMALEFARRHGAALRHVAAWGRWMRWTGTRWKPDDTLAVFDLTRVVCRDFAGDAEKPRATKIASAQTRAAVENLARSDRDLAATADQWDAEPLTLNTPGGIVDLVTGGIRRNDPRDYCTKATAVAPAPPGPAPPLWRDFLDRITGGDADLVASYRRMAGYCLTGDTSAHALFFGHGTGANGKSVFVNTLAGILGDYATTAPADVFLASKNERHPTELADLRGARLVVASELDEGRRWNEARIKSLTGGDRIKARYMRQDFFEYQPQFKLLIVGNHRPSLRGVDEAMRRRLNLLPFTVTIPEADRDPKLFDKLREEWPAILRWMIDGCLEWQSDGLAPCKAIRDATDEYMAGEDAVALWLDERCIRDPNGFTPAADLFASWKAWAEGAGEYVGPQKRFAHALEARGFTPNRTRTARGYQGIALLHVDPMDDPR